MICTKTNKVLFRNISKNYFSFHSSYCFCLSSCSAVLSFRFSSFSFLSSQSSSKSFKRKNVWKPLQDAELKNSYSSSTVAGGSSAFMSKNRFQATNKFEFSDAGNSRVGMPQSSSSYPHPQHMDASMLSMYACIAARNQTQTNKNFWNLIIARAKQLLYSFEPRDIAMILNSVSRTRNFDRELFIQFIPFIINKLTYYKSIYIAMTLSAYAKANIFDESLMNSFLNQIRIRYFEFQSPIELSMMLNALAKLNLYEESLFNNISCHIRHRMQLERFHVRELSVIVHSFAKVNHVDYQLFDLISEHCLTTISEGTPLEFSRLFLSYSKVGRNASELFEISIHLINDRLIFMSPNELINLAFAFGSVRTEIQNNQLPLLDQVFDNIRHAAISCLALFSFDELSSFLRTYSRWKIEFDISDLIAVVEHLNKQNYNKISVHTLSQIIYSLSLLIRHNVTDMADVSSSNNSNNLYFLTSKFLFSVLPLLLTSIKKNQFDFFQISRLVESFVICKCVNNDLKDCLSELVILRISEIDSYNASLLYEQYKSLGFDETDDVIEVLRDCVSHSSNSNKKFEVSDGSLGNEARKANASAHIATSVKEIDA